MGEAFRDAGFDTYFWSAHPMTSATAQLRAGFRLRAGTFYLRVRCRPTRTSCAPTIPASRPSAAPAAGRSQRARLRAQHVLAHPRALLPSLMLNEFCAAHPAECAGFERAEIDHYLKIYWEHFPRAAVQLGCHGRARSA